MHKQSSPRENAGTDHPKPHGLDANLPLGLLANNAVEELDGAIRWGLHPQTRHVIAVIHHSLSTDKARASLPTANDLAELLNCTVKEFGSYWEHFNDMSKSKIYKELAAQFN